MKCPICGAENWKNVDEFRIKPSGMAMCITCGFVSYPEKNKDELTEFYRKEYRRPPTSEHVFTGQRKLHYHAAFLRPLFDEWKKENRKAPVVTDIGAAFGMFLNWIRLEYPGTEIHGTELTETYKRNAFHQFGIRLDDEIDTSLKYDLICSYKVLEHMLEPEVELRKYRELLKPEGLLYISVPTWFDRMHSFGSGLNFDIEYYYSPNHINVWTRKMFERLIAQVGFSIERENHVYYDSTYLLSAAEPKQLESDRPEDILQYMKRIKAASEAAKNQQFDQAVEIWPDFPMAWIGRYEMQRAKAHQLGFETIENQYLKPAAAACPDCSGIHSFIADIYMRYGRYKEAVELINANTARSPGCESDYKHVAQCFRQLAQQADTDAERYHYLIQARNTTRMLYDLNQRQQVEAMNWIMHDNAKIPIPAIVKK